MPIKVFVDGNIGAGKTTFIQTFADALRKAHPHLTILVAPEPICTWLEDLVNFYRDRKRYAFDLQMKIINARIEQEKWLHEQQFDIAIIERSALGNLVFANMLFEEGSLTFQDVNKYDLKYIQFKDLCNDPRFIVRHFWITTTPEICIENIRKRGRPGEENIDLCYLQKLEREHTIYFSQTTFFNLGIQDKLPFEPGSWNETASVLASRFDL